MNDLCTSECEPCRVGAPILTDQELVDLMAEISQWELHEVENIKRVSRVFVFSNFSKAMAFANLVGDLAEKHGHHPALLVEWGKTTVSWWTHKIGGLHKNDIIMAAKTDELAD